MVNFRVEGTPITAMVSNRGHQLRFEDAAIALETSSPCATSTFDIAGGEFVALLGPHNGRRKRRLRPRGAQWPRQHIGRVSPSVRSRLRGRLLPSKIMRADAWGLVAAGGGGRS